MYAAGGEGIQNWLAVFIVATAAAVLLQTAILAALYFQMRRAMDQTNRLLTDLHTRVGPILTRVQILLEDTQPRITEMVADASHIVYLGRHQAQKLDRIFTDAADRLRSQLATADRILTGTLEAIEDAGAQFKRSFLGPMQKASALVQGVKVGLDFLRSKRRGEPAREGSPKVEQEDELFI
jgi:hypothetical protein